MRKIKLGGKSPPSLGKNTVAFHDGIQENPNKAIINESGLYSLVLSSKLPSAKKFKHWVTAEMLPSIRRHGAYATTPTIEKIIASPEFGIALLLTFQNGTFGSQDIRQKGENSRKYKKTKEQPSQCRTVAPSHL